jgi:hypothetical protein
MRWRGTGGWCQISCLFQRLAALSHQILERHIGHMGHALPQSPEQLLEELFSIFPQYRARYDGPIHDDTPTFHSVLMTFTPFFGAEAASLSEAQLRAFGELASAAVAAGGPLENAFRTCLLEHLHQIRASQNLRPYLSELARERTHT